MTDLAEAIYAVLRARVDRAASLPLTYQDLIVELPRSFRDVSARSPDLSAALGEVVSECHTHGLPALSAMVVTSANGRPGQGYYAVAHPRALTEDDKKRAWEQELAGIPGKNYPYRLD